MPHDVDDFLLTDPVLAQRLHPRQTDEKLLVAQDGDNLDLALYLAPALVERLAADDPIASLHDGNLADYCTALEGVSHFLYLTWNAAYRRRVTHLELEMQAEVDKYICITLLLGRQRRGQVPDRLHQWLFADPVFDSRLSADESACYRDASRYAAKYCLQLERRYLRRGGGTATMLKDLRRFYRLTLRDKIQHIELAR